MSLGNKKAAQIGKSVAVVRKPTIRVKKIFKDKCLQNKPEFCCTQNTSMVDLQAYYSQDVLYSMIIGLSMLPPELIQAVVKEQQAVKAVDLDITINY